MPDENINITSAIDERLERALDSSNYRISLTLQKQNARLKLDQQMTYAVNGGIFKITPELISFVAALVSLGREEGILLDTHKNPIEITDLRSFLETVVENYYEGTNEFLAEFKSIQKSRSVRALILEKK